MAQRNVKEERSIKMKAIDKEKTLELLKQIKHLDDVRTLIMLIEELNALDVNDKEVEE